MALCFRVFGTDYEPPAPREILDALEESEFEVSLETEEENEDDEEEWFQLFLYETSLDEPVTIFVLEDDELEDELSELGKLIVNVNGDADLADLKHQVESTVLGFRIEYPTDDDDENALLMCHLIAQVVAQKISGFFTVDREAIFDDSGELLVELAEVEEE